MRENDILFKIAVPIAKPASAILIIDLNIHNLLPANEKNGNNIKTGVTRSYILDRRGSLISRIAGWR